MIDTLDNILSHVRAEVLHNQESGIKTMPMVRAWFNRLDTITKCYDIALSVNKVWQFPYPRLIRFANEIDLPFLRLCKFLNTAGIGYDPEEFVAGWRHLKAVDQHHIISYIRVHDLRLNKDESLTWKRLIDLAQVSEEVLQKLHDTLNDSSAINYSIREKLGISMTTDVREAWKHWLSKNHPDKGGDHEVFVLTLAAYQQWCIEHPEKK